MALAGKYVAEITPDDLRELVQQHVAEDVFLDFKESVFGSSHPNPNQHIDDLLTDLISFANAFGGHIVVGIEDKRDRAWRFKFMPHVEARKIAIKLKGLAIEHIKPPIVPLDIAPFGIDPQTDKWVVVVRIPEGQAKPHMSSFLKQTKFSIRDGNRNRPMTGDEIQKAFVVGPQQSTLANIYSELQSVKSILNAYAPQQRRSWQFWRR